VAEHRDPIARAVKALQEPVRIDPGLDARVMAEIERLPTPVANGPLPRSVFAWLRRRRTIRLSPLGGLALAAGIAAVVFVSNRLGGPNPASAPMDAGGAAGATLIQFVLVAPGAASVSVVGDFNDWQVSATPLVREEGDGVWWVTVPLAPGRYRYAFLVDGTTWLGDPNAPAVEDEFGRRNSVVTIGGV
jgi:hypothetical protein